MNFTTLFLDLEEAMKQFLTVPLSKEKAASLLANLGLAFEGCGRVQNNLGTVILFWMGRSGSGGGGGAGWEVGALVDGLVSTESLGKYTTALCSEQGK